MEFQQIGVRHPRDVVQRPLILLVQRKRLVGQISFQHAECDRSPLTEPVTLTTGQKRSYSAPIMAPKIVCSLVCARD